jgi:hypothetical protein
MKLIYITGVLQTAPHDGVRGCLKCLDSNYSEMNVVTFILAKFPPSFEISFSIQVKYLPLQLCRQCVPLSVEFQILLFSENWHKREYCFNRMSKIV